MKKLIWFIAGISIGVYASKQLAENPKAQEFAADVKDRARVFGAAVSEGFREREAELAAASKPAAAKPAAKTTAAKPAAKKPAAKPAAKTTN